jgi:hypothetical protein
MSLQAGREVGQSPGEDPRDISRPYANDPGYRWVVFAAVILLLLGVTNLVEGLAAVGNPRFFVTHPRPIVGDLTPWGFVTHQYVPGSLAARGWMGVIAGLAGVVVSVGVLRENQLSRRIGVALLGLEAIGQLPRMHDDPLVAATIFTLGIIALSALIWYGNRVRQLGSTVLSSPVRGSESTDFDGLHSETEEARTWIAWRRAERNVTRAWHEWQAGDPRKATDLYHSYVSTLADEALAAIELERQVNRRAVERERLVT